MVSLPVFNLGDLRIQQEPLGKATAQNWINFAVRLGFY